MDKEYTVTVPVTNRRGYLSGAREAEMRAETIRALTRLGATRVLLCVPRGLEGEETLAPEIAVLKENLHVYANAGFEVGVWMSTLGHGGPLSANYSGITQKHYRHMTGLDGSTCEDSYCPCDKAFVRDLCDWIERMARAGAQLILLDDDFRLSYRALGIGCMCDEHLLAYRERVGAHVERQDLKRLIFTGAPNRYRDAFLDIGREALIGLAREIRRRVDIVNPTIRVGLCAVLSTWDTDGADAIELARALAGDTKPFLRTIGAPYWHERRNFGTRLSTVIEMTRMQRAFCEGKEIELCSEGDVYPRPRFDTPAAYLSCFDMALRADGGLDGILKYVLDYTSSPGYETGYIGEALRDAPAFQWIAHAFAGKRDAGVRALCTMHKLRAATLPGAPMPDSQLCDMNFVPAAHKLLCGCSIPVAYSCDGPVAAFGENARALKAEDMCLGSILDAPAARILMERGFDMGLSALAPSDNKPVREYFPREDEHTSVDARVGFWELTPKPSARVLSLLYDDRGTEYTGAIAYEATNGARFLIYPWDGALAGDAHGVFRSYSRQQELVREIKWLSGAPLPAACLGHPDMYMLVKRDESGTAIGLWNLSPDIARTPTILMDAEYTVASLYNCEADAHGREIRLRTDIMPFAFAGVLATHV